MSVKSDGGVKSGVVTLYRVTIESGENILSYGMIHCWLIEPLH